MTFRFRMQAVSDLRDRLLSRYGITVTDDHVNRLFDADTKLLADIQSNGVDTSNSEWAVNTLGVQLGLKGHWPLGKDSDGYTFSYFMSFRSLGKAAGYKFRNGWMDLPRDEEDAADEEEDAADDFEFEED